MLSDWKYPVGAAIGAAIMLAGCLLWYEGIPLLLDGRVDHVRHGASSGMVSKAELTAAEAKAAEYRRQVENGDAVVRSYQHQLTLAERAAAALEEQSERENKAYEIRLQAAGRACRLDRDDLDFLLRKP